MTERETALLNFYAAERRAGASPLEANERLHFFSKRLDALYARQEALVKREMERTDERS